MSISFLNLYSFMQRGQKTRKETENYLHRNYQELVLISYQ